MTFVDSFHILCCCFSICYSCNSGEEGNESRTATRPLASLRVATVPFLSRLLWKENVWQSTALTLTIMTTLCTGHAAAARPFLQQNLDVENVTTGEGGNGREGGR